jgi:predicted RNA-binding protein with RPS1 domain
MAVSKMSREASVVAAPASEEDDLFDFGEPEVIPVEISPGKFLTLKEPTANDLIEISKISNNKNIDEIEATLQTICILYVPDPGKRRLSLKEAKKLRPKQLKKLGAAINELLGMDEESVDDEEKEQ